MEDRRGKCLGLVLSVNEQILLDMPFDGAMRKVFIHPDLQRLCVHHRSQDGPVLSADPFGPTNSSKGVDLKTGPLIDNEEKFTKLGQTVTNICPTDSGAKDRQPMSFSPQTGLLYIPHENMCRNPSMWSWSAWRHQSMTSRSHRPTAECQNGRSCCPSASRTSPSVSRRD